MLYEGKNGMRFTVQFKDGKAYLKFKNGFSCMLPERLFLFRFKAGLFKRLA